MHTVHQPADRTPQPHRPVLPPAHWPVIDAYIAEHLPPGPWTP